MSSHDGLGYSIGKIFMALFALTAIEVAWGMFFREPRWFLWSGLLICALLKGILIFVYFMHMRFERFLIWSMILPTPLLVIVIFGYVTPDLAFNERRDYPNGSMMDSEGRMVLMSERIEEADLYATHGAAHGEDHAAEDHGEDDAGHEGEGAHAEEADGNGAEAGGH